MCMNGVRRWLGYGVGMCACKYDLLNISCWRARSARVCTDTPLECAATVNDGDVGGVGVQRMVCY